VDVLEAIKTRRSIRKFKKDLVPEKLLNQVLDAGRWAPSSRNRQPWKFIVLRSAEVRKRLSELLTYGWFLADAPLGIAVVVNPEESHRYVEDGAIASENMLLAAHGLGLGACWIASYGIPLEDKAKELLGVPEGQRLLSVIALGYPDEKPAPTSRKSLTEIVFSDKYGER
jgi:nitroreductase